VDESTELYPQDLRWSHFRRVRISVNGIGAVICAAGVRDRDPDIAFLRATAAMSMPTVSLCRSIPDHYRVSLSVDEADTIIVRLQCFGVGWEDGTLTTSYSSSPRGASHESILRRERDEWVTHSRYVLPTLARNDCVNPNANAQTGREGWWGSCKEQGCPESTLLFLLQ
jgi:hypothetical protein